MGAGGGGRVSEPRVPEAAGGRGEPGPGARARRAARSLRPPAPTRRFCFLSFLLLRALSALPPACGAAEERPFRCLQASSFPNRSSSRTDGAAWLGELQTHAWRNDSDAIRFLRPWSRGEFGDQEWEQLQDIFRVYRSSFTRDVHELDKMLRLDYPFEIQVSAGCAILAGNSSESAFHVAFQGREILSFQGMWVPVPDAPKWVGAASKVLNQDRGTSATIQWLLNDTCPRFVRGLLAAGKADLETQDTAFPVGRSEARGLAVRGFQSRSRPSAAGVPRLRLPPKAGVGDVDAGRAGAAGHPARGRSAQCRRDVAPPSNAGCGSRGGGGPVLPSEAQQPRRPGCHPLLGRGEPCLRGLDRRGSAGSAVPRDRRKRHLVQEAPLLSGHPVTVLTICV
ncbi:uncharacterized protein LOC118930748 isoform X1 [Manis pentadactyla]|uniref:uncharacterized protein LOC118930748 isoform X1 n=1 Tax=Manis pentadactyla TaxID=143292 RepID=UPI00255CF472|nr:uncharacterized protein LOC118930748 isoform X1 [Manis pentadactyla]